MAATKMRIDRIMDLLARRSPPEHSTLENPPDATAPPLLALAALSPDPVRPVKPGGVRMAFRETPAGSRS
jgi:hypothetical protein